MTCLTKNFPIRARDFIRAGEVSIRVQGLLKTIGFEQALIRRAAICAYESEMNVVMHGGDGVLNLTVDTDGVAIEVTDSGHGIEDIELALQEGYSTASAEDRERGFGAGMGLPNIKKNADTFEIYSQKGEGTHLKVGFRTAVSMDKLPRNTGPSHYVRIVEGKCNGCVLCMRVCPTKAIRVRDGQVARIEGVCIDCGECIRVCPKGAIEAVTTGSDPSVMSRHTIISTSPVFYAQFGDDVTPNEVLVALKKAFKFVYDQAYTHELCNLATDLYIKERREKKDGTWPLISPLCPVVNRLIAYRFPSLLGQISPMISPREIAARELKRRLNCEKLFGTDEFGVYHVTPCAAKMISVKEPMFLESSYIDGVLGINEVYDVVKRHLGKGKEDTRLHRSSGIGIGWGDSGGEIRGLGPGNYLAVSGMQETIRYLEKMEMGLLSDLEYVEFRACPEGCIGGPLTVEDKYQAKRTLEKLVQTYGVEKKVKVEQIRKLYEEGWFFSDKARIPLAIQLKRLPLSEAIEREGKVEQILGMLPRKECGVCGSPDCRIFAEDVVDGRVGVEKCIFLEHSKEMRAKT